MRLVVCLSVCLCSINVKTAEPISLGHERELFEREKCQRFLLLKMHQKKGVFDANSDF